MTVKTITFGDILNSAAIDDLDAAVLRLQDIAGIDDGGVASQCFSGFDWEKEKRGERIKALAFWLGVERRYEEDEPRDDQVDKIAARFAEVLRSWLNEREFKEMVRKNTTPAYGYPICASHDYCDANMAMMEAFESVVGHNIIPHGDGEITEENMKIWADAWDRARDLYIGQVKK